MVHPVVSYTREQGIILRMYIDDGLTATKSRCIVDHCEFVVNTFTEFGFVLNNDKSSLEPETTTEYIGYLVGIVGPAG